MDVKSTYKYARISPYKAREVAREIQGLPVSAALDILTFTPRKAARLLGKTMKAALADAENNFELDLETLTVKEAVVGDGPTFKRFKPRARGSAAAIRKRTSHLYIILTDEAPLPEPKRKSTGGKQKAKAKAAAPAKKAPKKAEPADEAQEAEVIEVKADAVAVAAPEGGKIDEKYGLIYSEAPEEVDDLKEISGVGEVLEGKLHDAGVYTYRQIADWTPEQVEAFDEVLSFKDRITRDEWLKQASTLYEAKYGKA